MCRLPACRHSRKTADAVPGIFAAPPCHLARLHRRDELEKYDDLITVKYFDGCVYRIAVFSPREGRYAYMLERFDMRSAHWSFRYEKAMEFQTLSELYEALKDTFDDVWFEEE